MHRSFNLFVTFLEREAEMFMHIGFIGEIEYENNMVTLFKSIWFIGLIKLKAEDASHQHAATIVKYFINDQYVCKIMNTYLIIHVATNNRNNHLPIIYSATSN